MPKNPRPTLTTSNKGSQRSGDTVTSATDKRHIAGQTERAPMAPHLSSSKKPESENKLVESASEAAASSNEFQSSIDEDSPELSSRTDRIVQPSEFNRARPKGSLEDLSGSARGAVTFFVFAFLGMTFIAYTKMNHIDLTWEYGKFIVTAVPIAVMFTYAIAMVSFRSLRLKDDQAGDNLYYLGFLFTLSSIGVSLYQFTDAASADEIVSNFGIAVTSTIAGLMLRIVINQTRTDPAQVERVSRQDLSEASRKLRRELDIVTREMSALGRTTHQKTKDILDVQRELVSAVKKFVDQANTQSGSENTTELAKRIHDQLDAIHQSVKNNRDTYGELVRGTAGDIIKQISTSSEVLLAELEKQGHQASDGHKSVNAVLENIGTGIERSVESQEETIGKLSALIELAEISSQQSGNFGRGREPKKRRFWSRIFMRGNG